MAFGCKGRGAHESEGPRVLAEGRAGRVVACAAGHTSLQIGAMSLHLTEPALRELHTTLRKAVRALDEERAVAHLQRGVDDVQ